MADPTERELVEQAQLQLSELKKTVAAIRKINADAGRAVPAAAAFRALCGLNNWHADVTDALLANWPEWAAEVTTQGPGGR
jgi:hypothetical protein